MVLSQPLINKGIQPLFAIRSPKYNHIKFNDFTKQIYNFSTKIRFGFRFASSRNPFVNPAVLKIIYCTFFAPVKDTIAGVFSCNVCSNSSPFSFFVYLHSPKIKFFSSFSIATISISLACLLAFPNLAQNQFARGRYASKRVRTYIQQIIDTACV